MCKLTAAIATTTTTTATVADNGKTATVVNSCY